MTGALSLTGLISDLVNPTQARKFEGICTALGAERHYENLEKHWSALQMIHEESAMEALQKDEIIANAVSMIGGTLPTGITNENSAPAAHNGNDIAEQPQSWMDWASDSAPAVPQGACLGGPGFAASVMIPPANPQIGSMNLDDGDS